MKERRGLETTAAFDFDPPGEAPTPTAAANSVFDAEAAADVFLEATRGRPELRDELLEEWGTSRGLTGQELSELRGAVVVRALVAVARARRG